MDDTLILAVLLLFTLVLLAASFVRRAVVFEYQKGLLYNRGKFSKILEPGEHYYLRSIHTIYRVDSRTQTVSIPGQEVLTADNVSLKVSLAASYKVADPYLALNGVANYQEALYLLLQLNLRDAIGALEIDDLLARRSEIGQSLLDKAVGKAKDIGLELLMVNLKDVMFPGELKNIFAQVVNARKEGLAALERARGESAALRNMANAARLFDNNPSLRQLRLFQVLEKHPGNTVVLMPPEGVASLKGLDDTRELSE